jgi:hypothetical protein
VVVSNDSDLAEPMRVLITEFDRVVGLVASTNRPSNALLGTGPQIIRELRGGVLGLCQSPEFLDDEHGRVRKPDAW